MTAAPGDEVLRIEVARAGGVAGLTRRWAVDPEPAERSAWASLVEACPWDAAPAESSGAARVVVDRFVWAIVARTTTVEHRASVPEPELEGPWRELVERVRAEGGRG
ncbi:protealysin inhibitor emfourin [Homoserinibacter sp. YIM 151385]|uniref:protealysin inhibitor emfourin n=1 Tax=Homoserinibacter sp. YIM 151385 TaxID=2985506 RepID=UPI0022F0BF46|nr:protealysin inhibitor emfourin [Homoserinibacter sp. YIM 151385]WBU38768.1 hypothetical protein OF852_04085 [Homoserinibacter sp. YIM 151385]